MDLDTWRPAIIGGAVVLIPVVWKLLCAAEDWLREKAHRRDGETRQRTKGRER